MHKILYVVACSLVIVAVLSVLARALTPFLNEYRSHFENWASHYLNVPIKIHHVMARWNGFYPDLEFQNVIILNQDRDASLLHINKLKVDIDLIRSVFSFNLQPGRLEISGVHVKAQGLDLHSLQLSDIIRSRLDDEEVVKSFDSYKLLEWLLRRPSIVLKQVECDFHTKSHGVIRGVIDQLVFKNNEKEHVLYGYLSLHHPFSAKTYFKTLITGNANDLEHLTAKLYLNIQDVMLSKWEENIKLYGSEFTCDALNGEFWIKWEHQEWREAQSIFDIKNLKIQPVQSSQFEIIDSLSGHAFLDLSQAGWVLTVDRLGMKYGEYSSSDNSLVMRNKRVSDRIREELFIRKLGIKEGKGLLLLFNFIPHKMREMLKGLQPSGQLYDLFVKRESHSDAKTEFSFSSRIDRLSLNRWKTFPGVKGLSGVVALQSEKGVLSLDSSDSRLDFGKLFLKPVRMTGLKSSLHWEQLEDKSWNVEIRDFASFNEHVALRGQGALRFPKEGGYPVISLLAGFDINDSKQVKHYLPLTIIDSDAIGWLNDAFIRGRGADGTVILRGDLQHFPFDHNEGVFVVDAKVRDTDLHYAPKWPDAYHLYADLIFSGRSMFCSARSGEIYRSKIRHLEAVIPYMGEDKPVVLNLKGSVDSDGQDLFRYLKESPLHEDIDDILEDLELHGETKLDLSLAIPVVHPEKTTVKGGANFSKAELRVPKFDLLFNQLNGQVFFTEQSLWSNEITAQLLQSPVKFKLNSAQSQLSKKVVQVDLNGRIPFSALAQRFPYLDLPQARGSTSYHAKLTVPVFGQKKKTEQNLLVISSDLRGMRFDFPSLLMKSSQAKLPFSLWFWFGNSEPMKLLCSLKDSLSLSALFKEDSAGKQDLFNMHIHFGKEMAAVQSKRGLYVDGYLPTFDWEYWMQARNRASEKDTKEPASQFKEFLRAIHLKIGHLAILKQNLMNAVYQVTPLQSGWKLGVSEKNVKGELTVPDDLSTGVLSARFDRLFLRSLPGDKSNKIEKMNPGSISALDFHIGDFKYGDQEIGEVALKTSIKERALQVDSLEVHSDLTNVKLNGVWGLTEKNDYKSYISGSIDSGNVTELLRQGGYFPSLSAKTGEIEFDLNWPGVIYSPVFKEMKGKVTIHLKKGRVVDLGERADAKLNMGRILTLLSVNRLFSMDFSDLAHSGYSFNVLRGELNVHKGELTTRDLVFDGSVARIGAIGVVNFLEDNLDLKLTVMPYVTSSLPIVATIAGGPIAGAVTWIADKVIGDKVNKLTSYNYSVKGSLDSPVIEEIKKEKTE